MSARAARLLQLLETLRARRAAVVQGNRFD